MFLLFALRQFSCYFVLFSFCRFALPIRYSLLVLSFAHGICFCMSMTVAVVASAFVASFYVLKTANLLQLCRTRRRRQLLAQRQRRQRERDGDVQDEEEDEHAQQAKSSSDKNNKLQFPITHTQTYTQTHENSAH